jgi:hypothetical protein
VAIGETNANIKVEVVAAVVGTLADSELAGLSPARELLKVKLLERLLPGGSQIIRKRDGKSKAIMSIGSRCVSTYLEGKCRACAPKQSGGRVAGLCGRVLISLVVRYTIYNA